MNDSTVNHVSENKVQQARNEAQQEIDENDEMQKFMIQHGEMPENEIKQWMLKNQQELQLPSITYASTVNKKPVQPILDKMELNRMVNVYESYKKAKALPDDVPIYLYSGHGRDICQEDNTPVIKVVPDNCIYITLTTCGKVLSGRMEHILEQFHQKNKNITEILQKPYIPGNKKKIADFFGQDNEDVHIHYPGMTYIENMFHPLASYETTIRRYIQNSGLLEKSTFEKEDLIQDMYNFTDSEGKIIDLVGSLKLKKYIEGREIFTKDDVIQMVNKYYADTNMKLESKGRLKKEAYEMVENLFKQDKRQHRNAINLMFWKIVSNKMYKKSTIASLFKSSVIPTKTFMDIVLKQEFPDKDILSEDEIDYLNLIIREKNSKLMNKFPGIHIAHICRNVQPTCEEQANFRRVMSKQQDNTREAINVNEKQIGFYDLLGKIRKNKNQVNTILQENKELIEGLNNSSRKQLINYIMSHSPLMNASKKNNLKKKLAIPNNNTYQKGGSRKTRKNRK